MSTKLIPQAGLTPAEQALLRQFRQLRPDDQRELLQRARFANARRGRWRDGRPWDQYHLTPNASRLRNQQAVAAEYHRW